jgi:TetR/AcrR family macrolide resistance operon transcriptional repressor
MLRSGPSHFTLSEVATAVGISRAALIQRFSDRDTLHLRVMEMMTAEVRDYFDTAPRDTGLGPLWAMLQDLIGGMGGGEGTEGYLLLYWGDIRVPALLSLAQQRNEMVRNAIRDRLPPAPHDPQETASLVQSVIQGACMQWLIDRDGPLADFMMNQTRRALSVLYPDFSFA